MRYAIALLFLSALALVGCKSEETGPVTTVEPPPPAPPTVLEPIPPAEPAAEPAPAPAPEPASTWSPPPRSVAPAPAPFVGIPYTVEKGDTLWSIAQKHLGNGQRWREIVDLNPGLEPAKMKVGQVILIPAK